MGARLVQEDYQAKILQCWEHHSSAWTPQNLFHSNSQFLSLLLLCGIKYFAYCMHSFHIIVRYLFNVTTPLVWLLAGL